MATANKTTDESAGDPLEGITTLSGARQGGGDPQPTDDPEDLVTLYGPGGTKVTAPSRLADTLAGQGFTKSKPKE